MSAAPKAYAYDAKFLAKSPEKYQEATRRALQGFAETHAAVYAQARREVDVLRREITAVFSRVDLLVVPTMLGEPVTIADSAEDVGGIEAALVGRAEDRGENLWGVRATPRPNATATHLACDWVARSRRLASWQTPKTRVCSPRLADGIPTSRSAAAGAEDRHESKQSVVPGIPTPLLSGRAWRDSREPPTRPNAHALAGGTFL